MSNRLLFEANELLRDLKSMRKRVTIRKDQLKAYKGWVLVRKSSRTRHHSYFDVIKPKSGRKTYLGNESCEQVLNVKRYRYAAELLDVLDSNIKLLEDLIENYVSPEYQSINSRLPETYQTSLSESLSSAGAAALRTPGVSAAFIASLPQQAIIWKQRLEAKKAEYPLYKPEQLKHPALNGEMMRSKSEVIIANIMLLAGIPFVYEVPLKINGEMILPDFTILSLIDLSTEIIIEHQGIIFQDDYSEKFIRSLRLYLQSDWVPNENLFFTFDDVKETLDVRQVTGILRKFVDPSINDVSINAAEELHLTPEVT